MTLGDREEFGRLRECVQDLAIQIARLSQAIEPLVQVQEDVNALRDRVADLQGFRSAAMWLTGLVGLAAVARFVAAAWAP